MPAANYITLPRVGRQVFSLSGKGFRLHFRWKFYDINNVDSMHALLLSLFHLLLEGN